NVLLGEHGETLVIDWGLAKELGEEEVTDRSASDAGPMSTRMGAVLGTPHWMSPEQARAEPVDARTDVWALGAILHAVLAGRPPADGGTSEEVLGRLRASTVLPALPTWVPPDLASIVRRALARDPGARYTDGGAFAADLRRFLDGQLVATHRYGPFG